MATLNKAAIMEASHRFTRQEMKGYIESVSGENMTEAQFDQAIRKLLPKESYYQERIMQAIRKAYPGAFVWKAAAGPYSRGGIPDVCVILDGRFYGFEVKRPYVGELSKLQEITINDIRAAGGIAGVVSFPEEALKLIQAAGDQPD